MLGDSQLDIRAGLGHIYQSTHAPPLGARPSQSQSTRILAQRAEHPKHRRTRNGCGTCRQRRVKCDEARPNCNRCLKKERECIYKENHLENIDCSEPKSVCTYGNSESEHTRESTKRHCISRGFGEDKHDRESLSQSYFPGGNGGSIVTADELARSPPQEQIQSLSYRKSPSRTTECTHHPKFGPHNLPQNVQFYLDYHHQLLPHHQAYRKHGGDDSLNSTFFSLALNFKPLLYAIVAFAAYHNSLSHPESDVGDFLEFYDTSITSLRQSLNETEQDLVPTLLTMLQLASIEEYLGNWTILRRHQRAAYKIIIKLFNPQIIVQSERDRNIVAWYIRFDLLLAAISGEKTDLGREWFDSCAEFRKRQAIENPKSTGVILEKLLASSTLITADAVSLLAFTQVDEKAFNLHAGEVLKEMNLLENQIAAAFADSLPPNVEKRPNCSPPSNLGKTDYLALESCHARDYCPRSLIIPRFWALGLLLQYQRSIANPKQMLPALHENAQRIAEMLEAVDFRGAHLRGSLLDIQATVILVGIILSKNEQYRHWTCEKLALIEKVGYICSSTLRKRMSNIWSVDVTHWWLQEDEGYPRNMSPFRGFADFREDAVKELDNADTDLRNMVGVFERVNLMRTKTGGHH